jgi:hypothetical protein
MSNFLSQLEPLVELLVSDLEDIVGHSGLGLFMLDLLSAF